MHLTLVLLAILTPIALHIPTVRAKDADLLVHTTSGPVQGFLDNVTTSVTLGKWLGVPFAADTSGQNRWRPPKPISHGDIFNASTFGPACLQGRYVISTFQVVWFEVSILTTMKPSADGGNGTSIQSEDCLRVNIIAPHGEKNLPVYVYS